MTANELLASAAGDSRDAAPPHGLAPLVRALWLEASGDWDGAHGIAQDDESRDGAWVHAYLHRKENDATNAVYWYGRAGRPVHGGALEDEWRSIVTTLLGSRPRGGAK